ncbi:Hypothetical protein PEIBARAKI_5320 [Petrimonas sp. IBARAKI]|nr:Hypothetical protein PEIBARAKI_5320 [Petrimonas sp. IBARAKI]
MKNEQYYITTMESERVNNFDKQHINRLLLQEKQINALFNQLIRLVAPEMRKWKDAGNKNSVWIRNAGIENKINRILNDFRIALEKFIKENQEKAWMSAIDKNDLIVEQYIKGMALSSIAKEGMFFRNLEALKVLQNRIDDGMNLSKRVWDISKQTKGHIELFLESGLSTGRSAEAIGRDFRQLLYDPNKRFRRTRDEEGNLVLSQPMKDYHPGWGVYRSSRMNALRVASTETNMGYRMSDAERWKQLDFILGYEVKRSANAHPCVICDSLKGKYPKGFVFPGWHPFCICYAVPIVMEHDDFADFLLKGAIPKEKFIKDIPAGAREWVSGYMGKNPKTGDPYFVKYNKPFFVK